MNPKSEKRFININLITVVSLFILILAGGVVRSSGSGMGCPDWPKCFDQYIPPTDISQLPVNYQQRYVDQRIKKNEKFAKLLDKAGYRSEADKIRKDQSIKVPEEFNAGRTWTEYINRLIGAIVGVFLLLTFVSSIVYLKNYKRIFWLSFINLILVFIQAWLGSIVVSTNLTAWIITVHMLLALVILAVSIYTYYFSKQIRNEIPLTLEAPWFLKFAVYISLALSIIQITVGTELRESVDAVADTIPEIGRNMWLSKVGNILNYHRDQAILVLAINVWIFFLVKSIIKQNTNAKKYAFYCLYIVGLQIVTGLALSYLALPPTAQALHILFASLMFGAQFYLLLIIINKNSQHIKFIKVE